MSYFILLSGAVDFMNLDYSTEIFSTENQKQSKWNTFVIMSIFLLWYFCFLSGTPWANSADIQQIHDIFIFSRK